MTLLLTLLTVLCAACSSDDGPSSADLQAPDEFRAAAAGTSGVLLTWRNRSSGHAGYCLERAEGDADFALLATLPASAERYEDRVIADNSFRYRLSAFAGDRRGASAETSFSNRRVLAAVQHLTATATEEGVRLAWEDCSQGEEGYIVYRAVGDASRTVWKTLPADAVAFTDGDAGRGVYTYTVVAYYEMLYSPERSVIYSSVTPPQVALGAPESSAYMVSIPVTLADDGGEASEAGICWAETAAPTVADDSYTYFSKLSLGGVGYGNAVGLEYGKTYCVRAWARNGAGVAYSAEKRIALGEAPEPLRPAWTEITDYELPAEVKLYRTTTTVTGVTVNAWYAVADLSSGNVELKCALAQTLTAPGDYVRNAMQDEEVYVVTNGGYFGGGVSYSYLRDRGAARAGNIAAVTRGESYALTRGAIGVDASQRPSLYWVAGGAAQAWAYERPLPQVEGQTPLTASGTYPSERIAWDNYSGAGGGPVLVRDGRICFDYLKTPAGKYKSNYELLQSDIFAAGLRSPRTAIGFTADRKRMVLMICDGRGAGGSQGVTLDEMARLMLGVGCSDVLNLDGGGSTTMVVTDAGTQLNAPSDGAQRKVISYVGFVKRK